MERMARADSISDNNRPGIYIATVPLFYYYGIFRIFYYYEMFHRYLYYYCVQFIKGRNTQRPCDLLYAPCTMRPR